MYDDGGENHLEVVSRGEWGAEKVEPLIPTRPPVLYVIHTYTDTDECYSRERCNAVVRDMQRSDIERHMGDIKYNFLVSSDGSVYIGRGWNFLPALNARHKETWENGIEIAHIGRPGFPSDFIIEAVRRLVIRGVNLGYLKRKFRYIVDFEKNHERQEDDSSEKDKITSRKQEILYE